MLSDEARRVVVIGGGPAGLAAAWETTRLGGRPVLFERSGQVGGLARTEEYLGNRFDIGPHRFLTSNQEVDSLFREMCGDDLVEVERLTRIYYRGKFFDYPLTPVNALFGIGLITGLSFASSYAAARLRRRLRPTELRSFEDWVVDRFGRRLFEAFFKTYTEKVWGIACNRISAQWAGQRIKGLSLGEAIGKALFPRRGPAIRTLADRFLYPRLGAGMLYRRLAERIQGAGGVVTLGARCRRLLRSGMQVTGVELEHGDGTVTVESGAFYLSSAPLTDVLRQFDPPPPAAVLAAADTLRFRNHICVQLAIRGVNPFPDNWIYVHSTDVGMARVTSYRNFSEAMAAASDLHPVTVEYFCFEDEAIWTDTDDSLIALAGRELAAMGIASGDIAGGYVVRSAQAYPVIEAGFESAIAAIRDWLGRLENFLPIGRSGMFKYNNQDHAIYTGLLAARTAMRAGDFDPWRVNIDATYHEGASAEGGGA